MLICIFTGFISGLPLYLLIQLVPAWLTTEGVGTKEIAFFALIQFPYIWKFVWAPLFDRYTLPFLGRRRGWLLVLQIGLLVAIAATGRWSPSDQLLAVTVMSTIVALFSATQDIVLDAYRRELLTNDEELGLGNSIHTQAYRISGLIPGALGLVLADQMGWDLVFVIMAAFMLIGIVMTLVIDEAMDQPVVPSTLRQAVTEPFQEFFGRHGVTRALMVLSFMLLYKLGDSMATALSTTFYIRGLGFELTEIGLIAKNAALWPSIIGGILGGLLIVKIGINRALWLFGVVQLVTILGFAWLSTVGHDPIALAVVIALEYLGVGLGTAAFVGFIARETNPTMAATQFALFTAITAMPRTLVSATTGILVEWLGWTEFFLLCTVLAVPGMLLLVWVAPFKAASRSGGDSPAR